MLWAFFKCFKYPYWLYGGINNDHFITKILFTPFTFDLICKKSQNAQQFWEITAFFFDLHSMCKDFYWHFLYCVNFFVVVVTIVTCMAITKLLVPYARKRVQLQNVCKSKKVSKDFIIGILEWRSHFKFFSYVQRFFFFFWQTVYIYSLINWV